MIGKEDIAPIIKWNKRHAFIILIATVFCLFDKTTTFLGIASLCSFIYFFGSNITNIKQLKPLGGYANWVTTIRLLIITYLIFSWMKVSTVELVGSLVIFVCLDAFDGFLARRFKQVTVFGQYFDMELDALFVLFSCLILYLKQLEGIWILIPGALRYLFVVYKTVFNIKKQEKRQQYAAIIAGVFFVILLISLAIQNELQGLLLKLSGLAIIISFGISFYQIHTHENSVRQ